MAMITFFTTCKDFIGPEKIYQYNALRSWRKVFSDVEILIFGNEKGIQPFAQEIKALQITEVDYGISETPYLNEIFMGAEKKASGDWLCYINADIIVTSTLKQAMEQVKICCKTQKWDNCLLIGQRWDVVLETEIQFNKPDWENKLIAYTKENGRPHLQIIKGMKTGFGIDYFFFRRDSLWNEMPAFLVHRSWWDTWIPWYVNNIMKLPVIDATNFAFVVHPLHPKFKPPLHENFWNKKLSKAQTLFCSDAPWFVTSEGCFQRQ